MLMQSFTFEEKPQIEDYNSSPISKTILAIADTDTALENRNES